MLVSLTLSQLDAVRNFDLGHSCIWYAEKIANCTVHTHNWSEWIQRSKCNHANRFISWLSSFSCVVCMLTMLWIKKRPLFQGDQKKKGRLLQIKLKTGQLTSIRIKFIHSFLMVAKMVEIVLGRKRAKQSESMKSFGLKGIYFNQQVSHPNLLHNDCINWHHRRFIGFNIAIP